MIIVRVDCCSICISDGSFGKSFGACPKIDGFAHQISVHFLHFCVRHSVDLMYRQREKMIDNGLVRKHVLTEAIRNRKYGKFFGGVFEQKPHSPNPGDVLACICDGNIKDRIHFFDMLFVR